MMLHRIGLVGAGVVLLAALGFLPAFLHEKNSSIIPLDRSIPALSGKYLDKEYLLVFVGYVGCRDVCSPRLERLAELYSRLDEEKKNTSAVLFVDFVPENDPEQSRRFAEFFHKDFDGISTDKYLRKELRKELDIYFSSDAARPNEYNHSDYLYLLKQEEGMWHLRGVVTASHWDMEKLAYLFSL